MKGQTRNALSIAYDLAEVRHNRNMRGGSPRGCMRIIRELKRRSAKHDRRATKSLANECGPINTKAGR